jgi:MarR-like DNA-binding transcriptional regulator SgrR of sgrS sRNA
MQQILSLFVTNEILAPYGKLRPHLDVIYESMDEDPEKFIKSEEEMMKDAQRKAEMEAMAEQKAIQAVMAQKGIEAKAKMAEAAQEHQFGMQDAALEHKFTMKEEDQKHEHRLIERGVNSRMASANKSLSGGNYGRVF